MLKLEVNQMKDKWLVEVIVTDWDKFKDIVVNKGIEVYSFGSIGLNLKDIYDQKDTLKWVNEERIVKGIMQTIESFNEEYGEGAEEDFEMLAVEHCDLLEKIQQLEMLSEKTPLIEAQLFYMKGYIHCLAQRLDSLQIKEEE